MSNYIKIQPGTSKRGIPYASRVGEVYGRLKIVAYEAVRYLCECSGSEECKLQPPKWYNCGSIIRGLSESCGCLKKGAFRDKRDSNIGLIFNDVKILFVKVEDGQAIAKCQCLCKECDCTVLFETALQTVKSGRAKSCGCRKYHPKPRPLKQHGNEFKCLGACGKTLIVNEDNFPYRNKAKQTYRSVCRKCNSDYQMKYQSENREHIAYDKHNYYLTNKFNHNEYAKINNKKRRANDPQYRLTSIVSSAVGRALKSNGGSKEGYSCWDFLPFTFDELREHLKSQYDWWMTDDNQGLYREEEWDEKDSSSWRWQLDHIVPKTTFKCTSGFDEGFQKCWALSNLRPLSAKQNWIDGVSRARHPEKTRTYTKRKKDL